MVRISLLLLLLSQAALAQVRDWKDTDGRQITAELVRVDGENLIIRRNGKLFTWPVSRFSEPDQAYAAKWQTQQEATKKERLAKLVGSFEEFPLTTRAYADEDNYLAGDLFKQYLKRTTQEYRKDIRDGVAYSITDQNAALYIPSNYDETRPFGVYVSVPASPNGRLPSTEYRELFEEHSLIYVSPHGAGNKEIFGRRMGLAIDSLASVKAAYQIDPNRCYIGGVSGGGIVSTMVNYLRPEHFRAAINMVRGALLDPYTIEKTVSFFGDSQSYTAGQTYPPFFPLPDAKHRKISRDYSKKRWVFISGDKDFNYEFSKASGTQWVAHGYAAKYFHVPGMGHTNAPAEVFEKALKWIEGESLQEQ